MIKILIVAAHPDDEVLGVGGTVLKHTQSGNEVSVLILGEGETSRGEEVADVAKREGQARTAAELMKVKNVFLEKFPDQKFDTLPILEIVKKIESVIDKVKPEIVYTHHAYDLNRDHQLTSEAVLTACRPQPGHPVRKILGFETLSSTEWQLKDKKRLFTPTEYTDISGVLDKKIEVLKIYQDELREFPHPRSLEGVRTLAKYRGMEVGLHASEAFQVIRSIDAR